MRRIGRALGIVVWAGTCLAAAALAADGRVIGRATDATGSPVEGVVVSIPSLGLVAATDAAGEFVLAPVPPGTYAVVFAFTGGEITATAEVGDGQEVRVDEQGESSESFAEVITVYLGLAPRRADHRGAGGDQRRAGGGDRAPGVARPAAEAARVHAGRRRSRRAASTTSTSTPAASTARSTGASPC